jgi:transposase-like protein
MAVRRRAPLILSDDERAELRSLTMRRKTAQALALRARIVLTCAESGQNKEVAAELGLDRQTVGKWQRRFVERRVAGPDDEPRSGAPRTTDDARIEAAMVRHGEDQRVVGVDGATYLAAGPQSADAADAARPAGPKKP